MGAQALSQELVITLQILEPITLVQDPIQIYIQEVIVFRLLKQFLQQETMGILLQMQIYLHLICGLGLIKITYICEDLNGEMDVNGEVQIQKQLQLL